MRKLFLLGAVLTLLVNVALAQTTEERGFQIGLISPLGTNGVQSHRIINKVSINILGGYSYGNTIFELGSLYNVNTHLTKGAQFTGVLNYSGNLENGVQLAGLLNIADEVIGLQFSGLVNVAKSLRGVQFGLINYADESDGVSIGLINIVKKGGKHEFEVAFSEALNTTVNFKLGTDRFYTIFSGGIKYINNPLEYGVGLGFGTHIDWKKGWGSQIEAMGYTLTEQGKFHEGVNMLTQLKFAVSKELAPHFKIFAGPVLNLTISDYADSETGAKASTFSPWSMWSGSNGKTNLNSWVGFTAGMRF